MNVLFFGGADFASPPPLGSTGRTRYVKITTADEQRRAELADWMAQAARIPGWT